MKEQLVSFEVARLAKEKGFNEGCRFYYDLDFQESTFHNDYESLKNSEIVDGYGKFKWKMISAPTQSLLQKWLRDVHNIHISIKNISGFYWLEVSTQGKEVTPLNTKFYTYEEALEAGLLEALKLIP